MNSKIIINTLFLDDSEIFANILKDHVNNINSYSFQIFKRLNNSNDCELKFESNSFIDVEECKKYLLKKLNELEE